MSRSIFGIALSFAITATVMGQSPASQPSRSDHFYWSIRNAHELDYHRTIRNSPELTSPEESELIKKIAALVRPFIGDRQNTSERELRQLAANTRVELVDLDGDGAPEVIAQANDIMLGCGATGNCAFWIFKKASTGYKLLLDTREGDGIGGAQLLTVEKTRTNGFSDLVLAAHDSAFEKTLVFYRYRNGSYHESACYDATWISTAGGKWRELKNPVISRLDSSCG